MIAEADVKPVHERKIDFVRLPPIVYIVLVEFEDTVSTSAASGNSKLNIPSASKRLKVGCETGIRLIVG